VQLRETLEVVDGTMIVFTDLQTQLKNEFYKIFVKSTDNAFSKKQNSFVLFKTNILASFKEKKNLFTIANCYFRLKNLVHESLPQVHLLSKLERDGDFLRFEELEKENKAMHISRKIKDLEREIEEGVQGKHNRSELIPQVESWVEQSIADCIFKFRKTLTKTLEKTPHGTTSFRAKFKTQHLRQRETLNCFMFSLEKPTTGQTQDAYINKVPHFVEDLDAHLLLFYRLLAVKYRVLNPLSGGQPWQVSESLEQALDTRLVSAGLKYLVLFKTSTKKGKASNSKPFKQPRFK
jgi:hypothetical protein